MIFQFYTQQTYQYFILNNQEQEWLWIIPYDLASLLNDYDWIKMQKPLIKGFPPPTNQ